MTKRGRRTEFEGLHSGANEGYMRWVIVLGYLQPSHACEWDTSASHPDWPPNPKPQLCGQGRTHARTHTWGKRDDWGLVEMRLGGLVLGK